MKDDYLQMFMDTVMDLKFVEEKEVEARERLHVDLGDSLFSPHRISDVCA